MEFGLFTEFASPPGVSEAAAFDESLGQMKAAEDMGFDAVWLAEIHFQKDRSVLASPLVVAAALAACTRRVKIGIAVQVLPLSHPLRLAEDVATVDHISKGTEAWGGAVFPGTIKASTSRTARAETGSSRRSTS
jgi:alkanesulfonate monooxygenase SsuD/methylene tetrahydromethanopterin reductase-like flavin-dependent oxidoreductase (luciferase family)